MGFLTEKQDDRKGHEQHEDHGTAQHTEADPHSAVTGRFHMESFHHGEQGRKTELVEQNDTGKRAEKHHARIKQTPLIFFLLLFFSGYDFQTQRQGFRKGEAFQKAVQIDLIRFRTVFREECGQFFALFQTGFDFRKDVMIGCGFQQMQCFLQGKPICQKGAIPSQSRRSIEVLRCLSFFHHTERDRFFDGAAQRPERTAGPLICKVVFDLLSIHDFIDSDFSSFRPVIQPLIAHAAERVCQLQGTDTQINETVDRIDAGTGMNGCQNQMAG